MRFLALAQRYMAGGRPSSGRSRIVVVIGEPNASRVSCAVVNQLNHRDDTLPGLVCALDGEGIGAAEGVECPVGGGHVTCECIQYRTVPVGVRS